MKIGELKDLSVEELQARLSDLEEESFNLRFQHTLGQLSNPLRLRRTRRDVAQIRTLLRENELGLRALASRAPDGDERTG